MGSDSDTVPACAVDVAVEGDCVEVRPAEEKWEERGCGASL